MLKTSIRRAIFPLLCVGLALAAWGLAHLIPQEVRQTRWEKAVAQWTDETPIAEVCAEVQVRFGVRLTADDVATWRRLCQEGCAPAEALRIVVRYRKAHP